MSIFPIFEISLLAVALVNSNVLIWVRKWLTVEELWLVGVSGEVMARRRDKDMVTRICKELAFDTQTRGDVDTWTTTHT